MNTLTIQTTSGPVSGDFADALLMNPECPYGQIPYRGACTSELTPAEQNTFWDVVDQLLAANGLTSSDFMFSTNCTNGVDAVGMR